MRNELRPKRFEGGQSVPSQSGGRVHGRHRRRMVRVLPLRHRGHAGIQQGLLRERRQRTRRHPCRLRDLRRRLRCPPHRRHRLRPTRRSVRTQEAAAVQPAAGGRRHLPDGLPADVRADRVLGPGPAGDAALHPGLRRRRRVGRRRSARRRTQPQPEPRLLGQLAAGRRARREHAGHGGAADSDGDAARTRRSSAGAGESPSGCRRSSF